MDVSANPLLQYLNCDGIPITTLDVSVNPALEDLHCNATSISTLDVSANPLLEWLHCSGTSITALDVSANPNLQGLDCGCVNLVQYVFDISGNPLTALITPAGYEICVDHVGNGTANIVNCLLAPRTVHFYAAPDSGWNFNQWLAISPPGLILTPDPYANDISLVASQPSHVRAVFTLPSTPTHNPPQTPPRTGDDFPLGSLLGLLAAAMVGLGLLARKTNRTTRQRKPKVRLEFDHDDVKLSAIVKSRLILFSHKTKCRMSRSASPADGFRPGIRPCHSR